MGSPSTKADCDRQIAGKQNRIAFLQGQMASYKQSIALNGKNPATVASIESCKGEIARCKAEIAELRALKKTLK
jgi:hypothetical protein